MASRHSLHRSGHRVSEWRPSPHSNVGRSSLFGLALPLFIRAEAIYSAILVGAQACFTDAALPGVTAGRERKTGVANDFYKYRTHPFTSHEDHCVLDRLLRLDCGPVYTSAGANRLCGDKSRGPFSSPKSPRRGAGDAFKGNHETDELVKSLVLAAGERACEHTFQPRQG